MDKLVIEEPIEFQYSKLPDVIGGEHKGNRFAIKNMVITDLYPNSNPLSYCGFGVWYDRKTKEYYGRQ